MVDNYVILATILSAAVYGLIFWWKARQGQDPPSPFDRYKFAATLVVALIIGIIAAFSGISLSETDFLLQMGAYAGYVAMVETILKALFGKAWPTSFREA